MYLVKVVLFDSHVQEPRFVSHLHYTEMHCYVVMIFFCCADCFFFVSLVYCLSLYVVITYLCVQ